MPMRVGDACRVLRVRWRSEAAHERPSATARHRLLALRQSTNARIKTRRVRRAELEREQEGDQSGAEDGMGGGRAQGTDADAGTVRGWARKTHGGLCGEGQKNTRGGCSEAHWSGVGLRSCSCPCALSAASSARPSTCDGPHPTSPTSGHARTVHNDSGSRTQPSRPDLRCARACPPHLHRSLAFVTFDLSCDRTGKAPPVGGCSSQCTPAASSWVSGRDSSHAVVLLASAGLSGVSATR
jgi:hypothetical protein